MNQPDAKNVQRSIRVPRKLDAKVLKAFRGSPSMKVKDVYILALTYATRDVELTLEEEEQVVADIRAARAAIQAGKKKQKGAGK